MVDISNKTLAMIMVAAIVVSLGGLFVSLDRLNKLQLGGIDGITGFYIANATVNVSIQSSATITVVDSLINFGACTTPPGGTIINVSSNTTSAGEGGNCTIAGGGGTTFPDWIELRNDGNNNLNISVTFNATAAEFLGSSVTSMQRYRYITRNTSGCVHSTYWCNDESAQNCTNGGYNTSFVQNWTNILGHTELQACHNLTFGLWRASKKHDVIYPNSSPF